MAPARTTTVTCPVGEFGALPTSSGAAKSWTLRVGYLTAVLRVGCLADLAAPHQFGQTNGDLRVIDLGRVEGAAAPARQFCVTRVARILHGGEELFEFVKSVKVEPRLNFHLAMLSGSIDKTDMTLKCCLRSIGSDYDFGKGATSRLNDLVNWRFRAPRPSRFYVSASYRRLRAADRQLAGEPNGAREPQVFDALKQALHARGPPPGSELAHAGRSRWPYLSIR